MKKFLLHTDGSKEQSLYCLYLAHVANTNLEDVEINVLQPEGVNQFEYLRLSPFEVNVFNYDSKIMTSMPKAHKFAYNLHDVFLASSGSCCDLFFQLSRTLSFRCYVFLYVFFRYLLNP